MDSDVDDQPVAGLSLELLTILLAASYGFFVGLLVMAVVWWAWP